MLEAGPGDDQRPAVIAPSAGQPARRVGRRHKGNLSRRPTVATSYQPIAQGGPIMAERVLRGSRLGAVSYETDRNAELAPRQVIEFVCPHDHRFTVPFSDEAEIPR